MTTQHTHEEYMENLQEAADIFASLPESKVPKPKKKIIKKLIDPDTLIPLINTTTKEKEIISPNSKMESGHIVFRKTEWKSVQSVQELEEKILEESIFVDVKPYSHNLIGIYLKQLGTQTNDDYVYETIVRYNLHKRGWRISDEYAEKHGIEKPSEKECERYAREMIAEAHYILARDAEEDEDEDSSEDDSECDSDSD